MNGQRQGGVYDPGQLTSGHSVALRSSSCNRTESSAGEEDPLQNPRPPEHSYHKQNGGMAEPGFKYRAKRWSAQISSRASVLWNGGDVPPPVPRHRDTSKYNQTSNHTNHIRLFERKTRAYTCRELLCIVFLPSLLVCLLGIALSSLVIYYQIGKGYEDEIERLTRDLSVARERDGVYLSSQKYRDLVSESNSQHLTKQLQEETLLELTNELEKKKSENQKLKDKIGILGETLDCTYTVVQSGGLLVQDKLETQCKLSQRAQLLLPVSDQAADSWPNQVQVDHAKSLHFGEKLKIEESTSRHRHGHGKQHGRRGGEGHGDVAGGEHWLLGSSGEKSGESGQFQQFLVTELARMEQNILDFSIQHDTFCSEFRLSLEAEVERRSQDLSTLAHRLAKLIEQQSKAVGKLESLASDQMYAEQAWVTSNLRSIRNQADRQSSSLQGFLTESFLPSMRIMQSGILEISTQVSNVHGSVMKGLSSGSSHLHAFLDSQKKVILSTKDNILRLRNLQNKEIQGVTERQAALRTAETQFQVQLKEAQRKIDSLLSTVIHSYSHFSSVVNSTTLSSVEALESITTRSNTIDSAINIAFTKVVEGGEALKTKAAIERTKFDSHISGIVENSQSALKTVGVEADKVEVQGKQMVEERQGAWELHYSNAEIMFRKKSDTNKQILQKHQLQTQETHSSLRQFSNELESLAEQKRQSDATNTRERKADIQAQCKNVAGFARLLSSELHARDSDLANYFTNSDRN